MDEVKWVDGTIRMPSREWLSLVDVAILLGITGADVNRMIKKGWFPRPVVISAKVKRWLAKDLVWFILGRELAARLTGGDPQAADDTDAE